jgi:hypothetical protein
MNAFIHTLNKTIAFYTDGFKNMSGWGRKVWLVIIIKLFIIYAILKIFFFPDFLGRKFENKTQRSEYVRNQILETSNSNDRKY